MMTAVSSSEITVNIYQTTRRTMVGDINLVSYRREKSDKVLLNLEWHINNGNVFKKMYENRTPTNVLY
jgi:hypothetical protein